MVGSLLSHPQRSSDPEITGTASVSSSFGFRADAVPLGPIELPPAEVDRQVSVAPLFSLQPFHSRRSTGNGILARA
jgi:hypothetical protein